MSTKDLTGMTFDKLTVIKKSDVVNKRTMWLCRCACGKETKVSTNKLTSGHTTSCGCKRKKFNGDSKTELYMHYRAMKNRCHPNYHNHKVYYDKGVDVCEEWKKKNGYLSFKKWALNNGYEDGLSLDRIDNNGGYSPDNCRWTTMKEQQNNRSDNVFISYNGKEKTLKQWSETLGLSYGMLKARHQKGITVPMLFEASQTE